MASKITITMILLIYFANILIFSLANDLSCPESCDRSFAPHTNDKSLQAASCMRGCRFHDILDFILDTSDLNTLFNACNTSCDEAYSTGGDSEPCKMGCKLQNDGYKNNVDNINTMETSGDNMAQTILLINKMCDSIFGNSFKNLFGYDDAEPFPSHGRRFSWSMVFTNDNGKMTIYQSGPSLLSAGADTRRAGVDSKTSTYIETNLPELDNSATPNLKHTQLDMFSVLRSQPDDFDIEQPRMSSGLADNDQVEYQKVGNSDWWRCLARNTRFNNVLFIVTMLLTVTFLIWFCVIAVTSAKEKKRGLSVNSGDFKYLPVIDEDDKLLNLGKISKTLGDEAPPLPIKLRVHSL